MGYPKFLGGFRNDATANSFEIRRPAGAWSAVALTQQFWFPEIGAGADHWFKHIQTQVRALGGGVTFPNFTITVSSSGIVTFADTTPTNFEVDWDGGTATTDLEVRRICGFNTNLAGAATYASANQHKFGWYPDSGVTDADGSINVVGTQSADAVVVVSPSGQVSGTSNATRALRRLVFSPVSEAYVQPSSTVLNRSYEEFWDQVLRVNSRFRYYPDRALTTYYTYQASHDTAREGTTKLKRVVKNWFGLYEVEVELHQYVA